MEILLYYAPNTCALAPYVTLTEANASFEAKPLNFRKNEHRLPAYLRLNPKHKVPLLMIDGEPLTESPAIQIWIARNFPQAKLLPSDAWQELKAISILSWCSSNIHPYLSRLNAPSKVCDVGGAEQGVIQVAKALLFENYKIADDMLAGREFFFDHFLQRRMRISSGACDAVRSSAPRLRNSRTAWRISKGSRSGQACRSCSSTRQQFRRNSRASIPSPIWRASCGLINMKAKERNWRIFHT